MGTSTHNYFVTLTAIFIATAVSVILTDNVKFKKRQISVELVQTPHQICLYSSILLACSHGTCPWTAVKMQQTTVKMTDCVNAPYYSADCQSDSGATLVLIFNYYNKFKNYVNRHLFIIDRLSFNCFISHIFIYFNTIRALYLSYYECVQSRIKLINL